MGREQHTAFQCFLVKIWGGGGDEGFILYFFFLFLKKARRSAVGYIYSRKALPLPVTLQNSPEWSNIDQ